MEKFTPLAKILHCHWHCWHWQISPMECLNYERNLRIWIRAPDVLFRGPEDGHFRLIFSPPWISNWPNGLFWTLKCDIYSRSMHVRVKVWYWKAFWHPVKCQGFVWNKIIAPICLQGPGPCLFQCNVDLGENSRWVAYISQLPFVSPAINSTKILASVAPAFQRNAIVRPR